MTAELIIAPEAQQDVDIDPLSVGNKSRRCFLGRAPIAEGRSPMPSALKAKPFLLPFSFDLRPIFPIN